MKNILTSGFLFICSAQIVYAETSGQGTHESSGKHGTGGLPQLDPTTYPSQIFWLLVVFTFLFVFFSKKTIPEISRTVENRQDRIQNDLESAEKLRKEVEIIHTHYENSLAGARSEAAKCYADVETHVQQQTKKKQEDLRERTEKDIKNLESTIAVSVKNVMTEMERIAAEIAVSATEKIINIKVDQKDAHAIVCAISKSPSKKTSKAA